MREYAVGGSLLVCWDDYIITANNNNIIVCNDGKIEYMEMKSMVSEMLYMGNNKLITICGSFLVSIDLKSGKIHKQIGSHKNLTYVDNKRFATYGEQGVYIWTHNLHKAAVNNAVIKKLVIMGINRAAVLIDRYVLVLDTTVIPWEIIRSMTCCANTLQYFNDEKAYLVAQSDSHIMIWSGDDLQYNRIKISQPGYIANIGRKLYFGRDDGVLFRIKKDHFKIFTDLKCTQTIKMMPVEYNNKKYMSRMYVINGCGSLGKSLLMTVHENRIRLWDPKTRKCLAKCAIHTDNILAAECRIDGSIVFITKSVTKVCRIMTEYGSFLNSTAYNGNVYSLHYYEAI
jgi:hypothetical protein